MRDPSRRDPRDFDDDLDSAKTRVTNARNRSTPGDGEHTEQGPGQGGCLVVIYTGDPTQLGKRFVLSTPTRIGRGDENEIVLEGDSVSRRHCQLEERTGVWWCADNRSTNGTYVNDDRVPGEQKLENGDRVKIGSTIFKYFSGDDVEALYHEEIYRMTIIDGLTGAYLKRYLLEHLDKEIARARRHERELSLVMFDLDHFKNINDEHGHVSGDYVLKEVARIVRERLRPGDWLARYGGEEFVVVLPETSIDTARVLGEGLRSAMETNVFEFQSQRIPVSISCGVAVFATTDKTGLELIQRADERLYVAKRAGRNRVE
ncbi:MAG TPA: GGDEF domain-containing protein [Polyangiaceae bacterium]|nr:GGDEF domain-containing protein [Polyangiaceae bacterium]